MGKEINKHRDKSRSVLEAFTSMFESTFDCIAYTDTTIAMNVVSSSDNLQKVFGSPIVGQPLLCRASSVSESWRLVESVRTLIEQAQTMDSAAPKTASKLSMSFQHTDGVSFTASVHVCWMPGDKESNRDPSMAFGFRIQEKVEVQVCDSSVAPVQASSDHLMDMPKENKEEYPETDPGTSISARVVQGEEEDEDDEEEEDEDEEEEEEEEEEEGTQQQQHVEKYQKTGGQMQGMQFNEQVHQMAPSPIQTTLYRPTLFEDAGNTPAASSNSVVLRPNNQGFDTRTTHDPPLVLPLGIHRNSGGFMPPGHMVTGMVGPFSTSSQEEVGPTELVRDNFEMMQPSDAQSATGSTHPYQEWTQRSMDRAPGIMQTGYMDPKYTNPEYTSQGYTRPGTMPTAPAMPPQPNMKWSSPMSAPANILSHSFMDQTQPIPSPPGVVSPPPGIHPPITRSSPRQDMHAQSAGMNDAASWVSGTQEEPLAASVGTVGHPNNCGPACKFHHTARGCKDGKFCTHCHVCPWRKTRRKQTPEVEQVATINPTRTTESGPVWLQPSAPTANAMSNMGSAAGSGLGVHRPQGAQSMQHPSDSPSYINMQGFDQDRMASMSSIKFATLESLNQPNDLVDKLRTRKTFLHFDETGSSAIESAVRATKCSRSCVSEPAFVMQKTPSL